MNRTERLKAIIEEVHDLYGDSVKTPSAGKWNAINDIYRKHGYHPIVGWSDVGASTFRLPNCS